MPVGMLFKVFRKVHPILAPPTSADVHPLAQADSSFFCLFISVSEFSSRSPVSFHLSLGLHYNVVMLAAWLFGGDRH